MATARAVVGWPDGGYGRALVLRPATRRRMHRDRAASGTDVVEWRKGTGGTQADRRSQR
jgi:hypothetical protein